MPWYTELLRCPDCKHELTVNDGYYCVECGFHDSSSKDLRTKAPHPLVLNLERTPNLDINSKLVDTECTGPEITYKGPLAERDSRQFMSLLSSLVPKNGSVLDLGCGPRDQANPIEYLGFNYVGFDYTKNKSDFLADAHSIPFKDESFDCIISYAVLEHLHNPCIAIHEVERVLKPGGIYVGAVSQGEPFHQSYFHMTPWGFLSLISLTSSLQITRLWPSMDTLQSLSGMGRYPRVIRFLIRTIDLTNKWLPFLAPRKLRWTKKEKELDMLYRAGSLCFCVTKQDSN